MPIGVRLFLPSPAASKPLINQRTVAAGDTITAQAAGTTETPFSSAQYVFPANSLKVGETYTLRGYGTFTVSALGPTQRPRIKLGTATLIDAGAMGLLANVPNAAYSFTCTFTVRAVGAAGAVDAGADLSFQSMGNGAVASFAFVNTATVDTTQPLTFALTTQYSGSVAGNSNTMRLVLLTRQQSL